ncbi:MAG: recombinase family protein [Erysipelotrichaceae bacterium]|nr:recombinase family protein [Erysipelotrichaceae bacterium]
MVNISYIRVSTSEQNITRQEEMFKDLNIDKYYIERISGKNIKID